MNTLVTVDEDRLADARAMDQGLLTFANHLSLFDDPLLTACLSDPDWPHVRWIAADALNFFGNPLLAAVFNAGKCVPLVRGAGVNQPGMAFLTERLTRGDWVHIFPEGGRSRDPAGQLRLPLKTGLATLIKASQPVVLPFYHRGMQHVLPIGSALPRTGQRVTLRFGEVEDSSAGLADRSVKDITDWATARLLDLQQAAQ
jgi:monolysocardiolipin acyltransferase